MLLKLAVLLGMAIFFFRHGEPGLGISSLLALAPGVGLLTAMILVVILLVKTWYGSAAIIASLIAFNLIGNRLLGLDRPSAPPDTGT